MSEQAIVIIGAGPAGLTAAYELQQSGIKNVVVVEGDAQVGGISKTVDYRGNRIDIGGHRFFSKSDWVMNWWTRILPVELPTGAAERRLAYQGQSRSMNLPIESSTARPGEMPSMMVRSRLSRIYFNQRFFDYPLRLNVDSLRKLGLKKTITFGLSYAWSKVFPTKVENSLEDFFVNRFGKKLYRQFFKEYTEKVWGVACNEISAEWGAQRVKSLSVAKAILHAIKAALGFNKEGAAQTSLIESFIYPKLGPGQMWEAVAEKFVAGGGTLLTERRVVRIEIDGGTVRSITMKDREGCETTMQCTQLISTMPVKDLISASRGAWDQDVEEIASQLQYRDFITVGLLYDRADLPHALADNWIYIQEPGVKVGRVQVFNNWSPYMVADGDAKVWLGLEFFCREDDDLWAMTDKDLEQLAQAEMKKIKLVSVERACDATVLRVPKAYPGYFGAAYAQFDRLRSAMDEVPNLFLIGRNGMHRYNNQDHSMLTAKEAANQIVSGQVDKSRIWAINIDDEYHEEKAVERYDAPTDIPSSFAQA